MSEERGSSVICPDDQDFNNGPAEHVKIEVVCELEDMSEVNENIVLEEGSNSICKTEFLEAPEAERIHDKRKSKVKSRQGRVVKVKKLKIKNVKETKSKGKVNKVSKFKRPSRTSEVTAEKRNLIGNEYLKNFLALQQTVVSKRTKRPEVYEKVPVRSKRREDLVKEKIEKPTRSSMTKRKVRNTSKKQAERKETTVNPQITEEEKAILRVKRSSQWQRLKYKKTVSKIIKVEPPISVKTIKKCYSVSLMKHCIFCLRKTTDPVDALKVFSSTSEVAERLQEVPCAEEGTTTTSGTLLRVLNKNWSFLQKGGHWTGDHDVEAPFAEFLKLPSMCRFCAEKLQGIHKIMWELMQEVNKLGKVIRESRSGGVHSWRADSFERALRSSCTTWYSILDTLEFIGAPQSEESSVANMIADPETFVNTQNVSSSLSLEAEKSSLTAENVNNCQMKATSSTEDQTCFYDEGSEADSMELNHAYSDSEFHETENCSPTTDVKYKPVKTEIDPVNAVKVSEKVRPSSSNKVTNSGPSSGLPGVRMKSKVSFKSPTVSIKSKSTLKKKPDGDVTYVITMDPITRKKTYTCVIDGCGKTIPFLENSLKQHQRKQHNIGWDSCVTCGICGTTYPDVKGLRFHMNNIHGKGKNKIITHLCDLCKVKVPVKDAYKHLSSHIGEEYILKCPSLRKCNMVFCTSRSLTGHLKSNKTCREATPDAAQKYFKANHDCETCGQNLENGILLRNHLQRSHENETKGFPCPIEGCSERFSVRQSVRLHLQVHAVSWNVTNAAQSCDICNVEIIVEEMEQHLKDMHHVEEILKCPQCPLFFSSTEKLVDHLYVHRNHAIFCHICGEGNASFLRHFHLRKHYFTEHQVGKKLMCEHCHFEFFSVRSLEEHVAKIHSVAVPDANNSESSELLVPESRPKNIYSCKECNVSFKMKYSLISHEIKVHGGEPLPCKYCEEKFSSYDARLRHEKAHQGMDRQQEFSCQVAGCEKTFKQRKNLRHHVASIHGGERPHVCEQCGKAFTLRQGLNFHIRSVHLGLRPFACNVCDERFSSGTVLKRHKLIHTGERPFACELCGQKFRQREVLKTHIEGHQNKGSDFKPTGPMNAIRKRPKVQN